MSRGSGVGRVAIIGAGLLGGSVAAALRRQTDAPEIAALARTDTSADRLGATGLFDDVGRSVDSVCTGADVVVVATPVDRIAAYVIEAAGYLSGDALITDVGSTKAGIVDAVAGTDAASRFVPAHPIAGSERTGAGNADAELFDDKVTIVTPMPDGDAGLIHRATEFWSSLGSSVVTMTPRDHDDALAAVSHVPHLIASLVAATTPVEHGRLTGSGWRDITRVAAGDPGMWAAIVDANRDAIADQLGTTRSELERLEKLVRGGDDAALTRWLAAAKTARDRAVGV